MVNPAQQPVRTRGGNLFLRTAAFSALVTILTLIAFGIRFVLHERNTLYHHLQDRGRTIANALEPVAVGAIDSGEFDEAEKQFLRMLRHEALRYVVLTLQTGESHLITNDGIRSLALTGRWLPSSPNEADPGIHANPFGQNEVYHYSHLGRSKSQPVWIHVGLSTDEYQESLRDLFQIVFDLAIPGLLIGFLASFIFANRLIKPIGQLKRFAKQIAAGDLEAQVDIQSNTELGLLGDTMNQMVGDLRQMGEREKETMAQEARLREHEILLKEIHHRVKNNLQVLSSLLRMQARRASAEEMKAMLKESEARIRSMGLIHEKLYRSDSLSTIDFKSYVDTLASQLLRMHRLGETRLDLQVDIDNVQLPLDTAMPCGLIINELISNSLKYAFQGREQGRIHVRLDRQEDRSYHMKVADDGIGMPIDASNQRKGSLGMNLVHMLVDQLNGEIEFKNGQGTIAEIRFREIEYTNRM